MALACERSLEVARKEAVYLLCDASSWRGPATVNEVKMASIKLEGSIEGAQKDAIDAVKEQLSQISHLIGRLAQEAEAKEKAEIALREGLDALRPHEQTPLALRHY